MSESVRDLLVRGIAAAKDGDESQARFYLEWALRLDPATDQRVEALFWLSEIIDDPVEKREYLEEVLGYQPNYYPARRSLAILDGRLDPQDIVDPNWLPPAGKDEEPVRQAQRFVCPQCGGQLTYTPDGKSLTCEYCEVQQTLAARQSGFQTVPTEQDFTIALATAKGHTRPEAMRSFECRACGGSFILSSETISLTCPYCTSVYVLEEAEFRELIPPNYLIPFATHQDRVMEALVAWLASRGLPPRTRLDPPQGLYLPVWGFTISGPVPWKGFEYDGGNWKPRAGIKFISYGDILVLASKTLPEEWADEIYRFDLKRREPYNPAYLADWPAEMYQVSLSDASLTARQQALERASQLVAGELDRPVKDVILNSKDLLVESFTLILVPVILSHYYFQGKRFLILTNGQNGALRGEIPVRKSRSWFSRLFKEL